MEIKTGNAQPLSPAGLGSLFVVYIVWSSTYLAIRIGVEPGSGFTPLGMGAVRLLAAGVLMLGFAWWRGYRVRINRSESYVLTVTSVLLWILCNGLVMWAEQYANSGFAALVLATSPLMVAGLNYGLNRQKPSLLLMGSLLVSLVGLAALLMPSMLGGRSTEFAAGLILCFSAFSWSAGTVFQSYHPLELRVIVVSGYQHLLAGSIFTVLMLANGESWPHASGKAWIAITYLILFGSILAFSAFINALNLLPINIAMTYSYVNPVLALVLGWWLLDEAINAMTITGAVLVLIGVGGVFRDHKASSRSL